MTRRRRGIRGQALVELAMAVLLLITLGMGIVEFGRILMIANLVTHAARDGARAAAATPSSGRNASGFITSTAAIETRVRDHIANVADPGPFTITVTQPAPGGTGGIPMVTVQVTGDVPFVALPNLVGTNLSISRSVSFRDEGR